MIKFVTFADSRWGSQVKRLSKELKILCPDAQLLVYDEYSLPDFYTKNVPKEFFYRTRGFGYWSWKAAVILDTLNQSSRDDIVIYIDAGFTVRKSGLDQFSEYIRLTYENNNLFFRATPLVLNNSNIVLSTTYYPNAQWCKGDVLDFFSVRHDEKIIYGPTYGAGLIFLRGSTSSRSLIDRWYGTYIGNLSLIDDSTSVSPNHPWFFEHRHDQAILSLILHIEKVDYLSALHYALPTNIFHRLASFKDRTMNFPFNASRRRPLALQLRSKISKIKKIFT
jgi:hypothetical protein